MNVRRNRKGRDALWSMVVILNGKWINQWVTRVDQVYFAAITLISILASNGIRAASSTILAGKSWVK